MGKFWIFRSQVHSLAGPSLTLLYPWYASVVAIKSNSKRDDKQWLAYWILYSFLTLVEMLLQPTLEWIPIWDDAKLVFVAWLVLPQFNGAASLYDIFVSEPINKDKGHTSDDKAPKQIEKKKGHTSHHKVTQRERKEQVCES